MSLRHRHYLEAKKTKCLIENLSKAFNIDLYNLIGVKTKVEVAEILIGVEAYLIEGKIAFFLAGNNAFPSLIYSEILKHLPSLVVDAGAVPYICNGADVMAPGVVRISMPFKKRELVVVRDERFFKAIAIGRSLCDSEEISTKKSGKVAENIHFVGDRLWQAINTK